MFEQNKWSQLDDKEKILQFRELWNLEKIKKMNWETYNGEQENTFVKDFESIGGIQLPISKTRQYYIDQKNQDGQNQEKFASFRISEKIIEIITAVQENAPEKIENIVFDKKTISRHFQWRIAFLYQDFDNPTICPFFYM